MTLNRANWVLSSNFLRPVDARVMPDWEKARGHVEGVIITSLCGGCLSLKGSQIVAGGRSAAQTTGNQSSDSTPGTGVKRNGGQLA